MLGYWKITTLDGQRFEIPGTYHGDMCAVDLIKKEGVSEARFIAEDQALTNALEGEFDGR